MEIILIKSYSEKPWRSRSTYQLIEASLKEKWRVHSTNIKDPLSLFSFIRRLQWEHRKKLYVFNIAEFLDEKNGVGFLPSLLDEMNIPHLGSSHEAVQIGLDKAETKRLLSENGIPTPRYFVMENQISENSSEVKKIGFPLMVKPIRAGGHTGIKEDSIVYNDIGLNKMANRIFEEHKQPALVEEFITGEEMREFSVGIIDGESRLIIPIEIDYNAMSDNKNILSNGTAQKDLERTKLVLPGKILDEITRLAELTFDSVGAKDYARVNIRMNNSGWYVLDINIMPRLAPDSFLPKAAKQIYGLEYNKLVQKLVGNSILRQKYTRQIKR